MNTMMRVGIGCLLITSVSAQTFAGPKEDAEAAFKLGDFASAMPYYLQLYKQGDAQAQFLVGFMFDNDGNFAAAATAYRKAADQGHAAAQILLAGLYERGVGVPQDYVQAHMWLNLATAAVPGAGTGEHRNHLAAKMTPAQVAEAQKLAREWKQKPDAK